MSSVQVLVIGFLLIALVHGQYDLNADVQGNPDQDSYGNNELRPDENEQVEQRFKAAYIQMQDKIDQDQEMADELEKVIRANDYIENLNNELQDDSLIDNGNQEDNNPFDNDFPLSDYSGENMQRRRRSFWKKVKGKLGGFGRKLGGFGRKLGQIKQKVSGFLPLLGALGR